MKLESRNQNSGGSKWDTREAIPYETKFSPFQAVLPIVFVKS